MARILPILASLFVIFFLISSFSTTSVAGSLDRKLHGHKKEKLTHLHFYWHDTLSGRNPTAATVVRPPTNSSTAFGMVNIIDDPLTLGPEPSSKLIGRAQGLYASASQEEIALLMIQNFAFTEGKYNGSTISVLGRNPVLHPVREMPVIGGSGLFRFARGYVQTKTHTVDPKTGDVVVEYNVYVLHY